MANGNLEVGTLAINAVLETRRLRQQLQSELRQMAEREGKISGERLSAGLSSGMSSASGRKGVDDGFNKFRAIFRKRVRNFEKEVADLKINLGTGLINQRAFDDGLEEAKERFRLGLKTFAEGLEGAIPDDVLFSLARQFERTGQDAGVLMAKRLRTEFDAQIANLRSGLAAGVFDQRTFDDKSREVLDVFQRNVLEAGNKLAQRGILTDRGKIALAKQFQVTGKDAGVEMARALRLTFDSEMAKLRTSLARGTISRPQFDRQVKAHGEAFRQGLLDAQKQLEKQGLLTQQGRVAIVRQMEGVGKEGGSKLGSALRAGLRPGLGKVAGLLRFTLAGAVAVAGAIFLQRMIRLGQRAGRAFIRSIERAGLVQQARAGFESLTTAAGLDPTETLNRLRAAARNTASDFDLMTQANFALQVGLPLTSEGLADLLNIARRLGKTLGRDTVESFRRLTNGIAKNEKRILDELGIIVDFENEHRKLARSIGKTTRTLGAQEKIQANLAAVRREGLRILAALGEEELSAKERLDQLRASLINVRDAIVLGIAEAPTFTRLLGDMADAALDASGNLTELQIKASAFFETMAEFGKRSGAFQTLEVLARTLLALEGRFSEALGQVSGDEDVRSLEEFFQDMVEAGREAEQLRQRILDIQQLDTEEEVSAELAKVLDAIDELGGAVDELPDLATKIEMFLRGPGRGVGRGAEAGGPLAQLLRERTELLRQITRIRLRRAAGGEDGPDPATLAKIERAREKLAKLREEFELAQEFGFAALDSVPPRLREALNEVLALRRAQADLNETLDTLGITATGSLKVYQDELADLESQALATARRIAADPDLLLSESAQKAREQLRGLSEEFRLLRSIGVTDLLERVPDQLLEAARQAEAERKALAEAAAALAELGRNATEEERAFVGAQARKAAELMRLRGEIEGIADLFETFPSVTVDFLAGLDPAELQSFVAAMRQLRVVTDAAADARARLERARRSGLDASRAEEALTSALARQRAVVAQVAAALEAAGFNAQEIAEAIALLTPELEEAEEEANKLAEALDELEGVARGLLRIADAAGILSDDLRNALQGAVELSSAIKDIVLSGPSLGNIVQGIGGAISFVSGVAGVVGGVLQGRRGREQDELEDAIENLAGVVDDLANALLSVPGVFTQEIRKAAALIREARAGAASGLPEGERVIFGRAGLQETIASLKEMGVTLEDLERISDDLGIPLDDLIKAYKGQELSINELIEASDELIALQEVLDAQVIRKFFETIRGQLDLLSREQNVLDLTNAEVLERQRQILLDNANLTNAQRTALAGADLTTAEGRAQAEKVIEEAFKAAISDPETLLRLSGALTPEEFLDLLGNIETLLDEIEEEAEAAARDGPTSAGFFEGATLEQFDRALGMWQTMIFLLDDIARSERAVVDAVGGTRSEEPITPFAFPPPGGGGGFGPVSGAGTAPAPTPPPIPRDTPTLGAPSVSFERIDVNASFPGITSGEEAAAAAQSFSGAAVEREIRRRNVFRGIPS